MKLPFLPAGFVITAREKLIIAVIMLLVVLIPTGTYLLSLRFKTQSNAANKPVTSPHPEATSSSKLKDRVNKLQEEAENGLGIDSSGAKLILGPTLGFKLVIEGRPISDQSSKVFVGIAAGPVKISPKYLLSFMVDVPASGIFTGLSVAGLDEGVSYTAYLKGRVQIATSSGFTLRTTTPIDLGTLSMTTGDVNEDNQINLADYDIVKVALGAREGSAGWNPDLDFNKDGVINFYDLSIVSKNLNKVGASGVWVSTPKVSTSSATQSGSLQIPENSGSSGGYWLWIPEF